jgi:hypothetical protein
MADGNVLLVVERQLAVCHRALWVAASHAETLKDQGLADDLYQLAMEVGALNIALLQSRNPRRKSAN